MSVAAKLLIAVMRAYRRWVSPYLQARCRFEPSCSSYAVDALARHGAIRGGALSIRRIARCHPWSEGGVDRVPAHSRHEVSG